MFETYLPASGLDGKDGAHKVALLRHFIGTEGQCLMRSITKVSLSDLLDAVKTTFVTRTSVIAHRFAFCSRRQQTGESIADFARKLLSMAANCNFKVLHEKMIRNQLLSNTCVRRIREHFFMEEDT